MNNKINKQEEIELLALSLKINDIAKDIEVNNKTKFPGLPSYMLTYNEDKGYAKPKKYQSEWNMVNILEEALLEILLVRHDILATQIYNIRSEEEIQDIKGFNYSFENHKDCFKFRVHIYNVLFQHVNSSSILNENGIYIESHEEIAEQQYVYVKVYKESLQKYALDVIDNNPVEIEGCRKVLPSLF